MIFNPARRARHLFSYRHLLRLYQAIHEYLPRKQRKEFARSWVVHNLLTGPRKRARFERLHGCTLPAMINLSPTERCNLNCLGCYAASYGRSHEMTPEQVHRIIEEAERLGIYFIGFLGGEPLLRKDLFPIIERHKDVAFRISTNGTILDAEILAALKRSGNVVAFFSLEGFEGDTDAWRGPGVFNQIRESMAVLKRERVLFGFSALLHAQNSVRLVSESFLGAMQDAGCKFGLFFPYGPAGDNARYDLALTEEQIDGLFTQLSRVESNYTMLILKEGYRTPADGRSYLLEQGCRAGVTIHITPEGNVEPCNGIQFFTENVFEKGLEQIFCSPFYRDIFACVQQCGKRCICMFQPKEVLEIIDRNGAKGSHPQASPTYRHYAEIFVQSAGAKRALETPCTEQKP